MNRKRKENEKKENKERKERKERRRKLGKGKGPALGMLQSQSPSHKRLKRLPTHKRQPTDLSRQQMKSLVSCMKQPPPRLDKSCILWCTESVGLHSGCIPWPLIRMGRIRWRRCSVSSSGVIWIIVFSVAQRSRIRAFWDAPE